MRSLAVELKYDRHGEVHAVLHAAFSLKRCESLASDIEIRPINAENIPENYRKSLHFFRLILGFSA